MVVVNDNGKAQLIKKVKYDVSEVDGDDAAGACVESSPSVAPSLSEKITKHLNPKSRGQNDNWSSAAQRN